MGTRSQSRQVRSAAVVADQRRGGCRSAMAAMLSISSSAWRLREVPLRWLSTTVAGRGLFAAVRPLALAPTCQLLKTVLGQRQM